MITKGDRQTVVAYGAAGFSSTSKGFAASPNRGLKSALARYAVVVDVPEHCSSQCCSAVLGSGEPCHVQLKKCAVWELVEMAVSRAGDAGMGGREPCGKQWWRRQVDGVLVCTNTSCSMRWNRDMNGARNMGNILLTLNSTGERPKATTRKKAGEKRARLAKTVPPQTKKRKKQRTC